MENTLATWLIFFGLLIGAVGGLVLSPETEVEVLVEVPVEVEVLKEVEVLVADASKYLDLAVIDFLEYVDDEELFECKQDEYNLDEISVSRVYDRWDLAFDDEDYTVNFDVKLEYDEDNERSCKKVFEVEAYYEANEDVKVTLD